MSDLRLELSPDDPFLASLSAVRAADDAAVTSAGYTSIAEYQTDLAWYRSINDTRDDASFGSKTMDQLQSHVSSNPHIYNWPASGSMFGVTLTDNGKSTAKELRTTNTGGYASAIKTAYHPFLLYADWHTRVLKAEEEGKAQKVKQLRSLVSTVPGLSTVIRA